MPDRVRQIWWGLMSGTRASEHEMVSQADGTGHHDINFPPLGGRAGYLRILLGMDNHLLPRPLPPGGKLSCELAESIQEER